MITLRKIAKIFLIVMICLVSLLTLVWGGLNALKFVIYSDYYDIEENVCINPGLGDGFVCQGICVLENDDPYNSKLENIFI